PKSLPVLPLQMLPPPTITAISTPNSRASAISLATVLITSGLIPKPSPPAKASPLNFKTIRLYFEVSILFILLYVFCYIEKKDTEVSFYIIGPFDRILLLRSLRYVFLDLHQVRNVRMF